MNLPLRNKFAKKPNCYSLCFAAPENQEKTKFKAKGHQTQLHLFSSLWILWFAYIFSLNGCILSGTKVSCITSKTTIKKKYKNILCWALAIRIKACDSCPTPPQVSPTQHTAGGQFDYIFLWSHCGNVVLTGDSCFSFVFNEKQCVGVDSVYTGPEICLSMNSKIMKL